MKLALINHPEVILIESTLDEGLREKLMAGLLGAGVTAAGMFGGQAMLGGSGSPEAGNTENTENTEQVDNNFMTTGVYNDGNTLVSRALEMNPESARFNARQQLINYFGGKVPAGVEETVDEQDGLYAVELRWSKDSQGLADQARQEMQSAQIPSWK